MRSIFMRLLRLIGRHKTWMMLATVLGCCTIGSGIGLLMTSAYIIARAALHPSIADLQVGIVGVRFFGISRGIFRYLERYFSHEVTFRLLARFRVWFYSALEPLVPTQLFKYRSGELLTRIVADIDNLEHLYVRIIAPPIVALIILATMVVFLAIFSWTFSLLLVCAFVVAGAGLPLIIHFLSKPIADDLIQLHSRLQTLTIDTHQGMAELLMFAQEKKTLQEFRQINAIYEKKQRWFTLISGMHEALLGLLMNLTVVAILLLAVPEVLASHLDGLYLSVVVLGIMAAFEAIAPLPEAAQHLSRSLKSGQRLLEIINTQPEVQDIRLVSPPVHNFSLQVENLNFRYPDGDDQVLHGIHFYLPHGSRLALVGLSGAGKSTLLHLLLRFWDPVEGTIRIGGTDIRQFPREKLRNYFTILPQNPHLFNETIRWNLLLSSPHASREQIDRVLKQVGVNELVNSLPKRYETYVGEGGLLLSDGERQRLALARACLRDAPIVILDEPTAHLDAFSEKEVLEEIWKFTEGKTIILITHRLIGLENVDQILVLQNGVVIQKGTHQQLVQRDGWYRRMWEIQTQALAIETLS